MGPRLCHCSTTDNDLPAGQGGKSLPSGRLSSKPTGQAGLQRVKNPPATQETQQMWVRSLGGEARLKEENGNPLQYSCLGNPMDRGACELQFMGLKRVGHN